MHDELTAAHGTPSSATIRTVCSRIQGSRSASRWRPGRRPASSSPDRREGPELHRRFGRPRRVHQDGHRSRPHLLGGRPAARDIAFGSASTPWGRSSTAWRPRRAAPLRRHLLRLQRLHAAGRPAERPDGIPSIWVWTHDSVFLGEDGPTHQPIEHLASLRAMPNLDLIRPADAGEVVEAWELASTAPTAPPRSCSPARTCRRWTARWGAWPGRVRAPRRHRCGGGGDRLGGVGRPRRRRAAGRSGSVGPGRVSCRAGSASSPSPTSTGPRCSARESRG
jgi:hypothetical protein